MTPSLSPPLSVQLSHRNYWINGFALFYVLAGYLLALICLCVGSWGANLLGTFLLIHTLMLAAYFTHEFIHGTVFQNPSLNAIAGNIMLFLTGSCYCHFRDLARNHLAHHKNRADFSAFSIADFLNSLPKPVLNLIIALEWLYFPALNFILRGFCTLSPFVSESRRDERWRTLGLLLVRSSLWLGLGWYSPRGLLLYILAYICFINILRFVDCFQHTYTVFQLGQTLPAYDLEHEETNTYSNLVSTNWRWLNIFFLNFGYHNAHHRVIHCPWYLLPQLDAELYPPPYRQHLLLSRLLKNYHHFRIHRLFHGQGTVKDTAEGVNVEQFVGGIGVSFLILREPLTWLNIPTLATNNP
jgi:fatty acid desaturase